VQEKQFPRDYLDWLFVAATSGIDWDKPPPRDTERQVMLPEEIIALAHSQLSN